MTPGQYYKLATIIWNFILALIFFGLIVYFLGPMHD